MIDALPHCSMKAANSMRATVFAFFLLLLGCPAAAFATSDGRQAAARTQDVHDTNHPFVLANDADFLAALIALYEESRDASVVAKARARDRKVRDYATRVASTHSNEIAKFRKLQARHAAGARPDFHYKSKMPDLGNLAGSAAERYYLNGLSRLTAAKIELAEFASGTVRSREIRRIAESILETKSRELSLLKWWIRDYGEK